MKWYRYNDGSYKVFFNASCCDKIEDENEKSFFKFLNGQKADSAFTRSIEERVNRAKANKEWRRQYMTWEQTIIEERYWAKIEGREEGAQQTAIANAKNALNMGLTPEQASQITSLPLEQVLALKEEVALSN